MLLKSKIFPYLIAAFFILLIIIFPEVSCSGVSRGLLISANVIIPSLFPFMICVFMIIKSGVEIKNRYINKFLYKIFGHNFDMFFTYLLSILGGYPVGARLIGELYKQNSIDEKTADIMLMYCVNAGPAFIISVVGGVFGSRKIGIILLISHITASFVIALFCGNLLKKRNFELYKNIKINKTFSENIVESVSDASAAILQICSFVTLFSVVNSYIDLFFDNVPILKYVTYFTEVTSAVTKTNNIVFISFLLGFSGISIWCQVFALSGGRKLNFLRFSLGRILHGALSASITAFLINILKIKISTYSNGTDFTNEFLYTDTALFLAMTIMVIVLLTFIYSKNNSGKFLRDVV